MLKASAFPARYSFVNKPPFVSLVKGVTFALVQLPTEDVLAAVPSNLSLLKSHNGLDKDWAAEGSTMGFFFFVKDGHTEDGSTKLRTRMLLGSLEDPATGLPSMSLTMEQKVPQEVFVNFTWCKGSRWDGGVRSELKSLWKKIASTRSSCVDPQ